MEQRRWWIFGTVVVLPTLYFAGQYLFAPGSEVRAQHAVEEDQERELAGKPALLASSKQIWDSGPDGWSWVFDHPVSEADLRGVGDILAGRTGLPIGESEAAARAMRKVGGWRIGSFCVNGGKNKKLDCREVSRHKVTLTGNRTEKVLITGIRARVLSERRAPHGAFAHSPPQGGGAVEQAYIDLDSADKEAVAVSDSSSNKWRPYTDVETRWVEKGEPLVFEFVSGTRRDVDYRWRLELTVSYDGRTETVTVPAKDHAPFRTVGWGLERAYSKRLVFDPYVRTLGVSRSRPGVYSELAPDEDLPG
ncbi:hypothetical protein [Streptomyces sp. NPDC052114]|uniref:hypothetical protein n=1 Tax=unclassified Streptomyces TaxID=2593676 RepID=UPI003419A67E